MRLLLLLLACLCTQSALSNTQRYSTDALFEQFSQSIFKVRIIDINSGSQSTIGTGFLVEDGSLLATNFHVVSALVNKPNQYRAEIDIAGESHTLELTSFDVVHDLAILQAPNKTVLGQALTLSLEPLNKGHTLYSIGNPHDIGMTVVEGTYNGLVAHRFIDSIHFSGAINSGMSGGPTITDRGDVVGINVASSGDQIGFLVPVDKLANLLSTLDNETNNTQTHYELIRQQITDFSEQAIDELLQKDWPLEKLADTQVAGQISESLSCWGDSDNNEDSRLKTVSKGCSNKDYIYINQNFTVGSIEYEYKHFSADSWNSLSFYEHINQFTSGARPSNRAHKNHVNNYACQNNVVAATDKTFAKKISYCVRSYKNIKDLYDTFYIATSIDRPKEAMMEHYTLSGVTAASAHQFLERFMEAASWQ